MKVSEVNDYIKRIISFDPILSNLIIEGEISNFKHHSSGHGYFSLKDDKTKINCVIFRSSFENVNFDIFDGQMVKVYGNVSIYERDGKYQLYVDSIEQIGLGELHNKFILLKEDLAKKGYFEKRTAIKKLPKKIGVITSPTGAAIRDILTVIKRRNKNTEVVIYPVNVQGETSKFQISEGIDFFNENLLVDTIILSRGGGSIEELWSFNEIIVANSIYDSKIPIISGVGHETDFTISDFVADRRAATPSEAAELSVMSIGELKLELNTLNTRLFNSIENIIKFKSLVIERLSVKNFEKIMSDKVNNYELELDLSLEKLNSSLEKNIDNKKNVLEKIGIQLNSTSPLNTLARGYGIIEKEGVGINSIDKVEKSDLIDIILKNGIIKAEVISKKETY